MQERKPLTLAPENWSTCELEGHMSDETYEVPNAPLAIATLLTRGPTKTSKGGMSHTLAPETRSTCELVGQPKGCAPFISPALVPLVEQGYLCAVG